MDISHNKQFDRRLKLFITSSSKAPCGFLESLKMASTSVTYPYIESKDALK